MRKKFEKNCVHELGLHLVFCPKYRKPIFTGIVEVELKHILSQTCAEYGWGVEALEIMPDHVHLCASLPPKIPIHKLLKLAKGRSSNYLRKEFPHLLKMPTLWSRSYFATTVGDVSTEKVMEYIKKQWEKK